MEVMLRGPHPGKGIGVVTALTVPTGPDGANFGSVVGFAGDSWPDGRYADLSAVTDIGSPQILTGADHALTVVELDEAVALESVDDDAAAATVPLRMDDLHTPVERVCGSGHGPLSRSAAEP